MVSRETEKKCQPYSINLFEGEWKLNLVTTRGASSKKFKKPWLKQKRLCIEYSKLTIKL